LPKVQKITACATTPLRIKRDRWRFSSLVADITQLQKTALELVKVFPDTYCDKFKVYDYGFTPILQYTKGGYAEAWEQMKLESRGADRKDYYLLFAREVNQANIVTKIWVDVRLPEDGKFSCLTEMQRSLINIRVEKAVAENYAANGGYATGAEMRGMNVLQQQVKAIVNCCVKKERGDDCDKMECPMSFNTLESLLKAEGFQGIPVKVIDKPSSKNSASQRNILVSNYAKITLKNENIEDIAESLTNKLSLHGKSSKAYIIDDLYYCQNEGLGSVGKEYNEDKSDFDIIFCITRINDSGDGILWIKNEFKLPLPNKDVSGYFIIEESKLKQTLEQASEFFLPLLWILEKGGECLTAAMVDMAIQYTLHWGCLAYQGQVDGFTDFSPIWAKVDGWQMWGACAGSLYKCAACSALIGAAEGIGKDVYQQYQANGGDIYQINWMQSAGYGLIGAVGGYIGANAGTYITKMKQLYPTTAVAYALKRVGLTDDFIKSVTNYSYLLRHSKL
jgi:hypothetical protein